MTGKLYVVGTPIGNLNDLAPRAKEVLASVDMVAAEDTRHSGRLLKHLNIDTPLTAYHDHGGEAQWTRLVDMLEQGKNVALISDAGTPLISDPGYRLVHALREKQIAVEPVPGPCAAILALCASGLPSDRFAFEGFPPHKSGARLNYFQALANAGQTLIFYESPHRIVDSLADMMTAFGDNRHAVLAREMTKTFETFLVGSLQHIGEQVREDPNQQKGEMVLLVKGAEKQDDDISPEHRHMLSLLLAELPLKQAVSLATKITGGQKNSFYQLALELKSASDS